MNLNEFGVGKMLIISGVVLIIIGVIVMFSGKFSGFPKLPGDILIKRDNFTFYFSVTSAIILSIILTLVLYLIGKFK